MLGTWIQISQHSGSPDIHLQEKRHTQPRCYVHCQQKLSCKEVKNIFANFREICTKNFKVLSKIAL
jgi:hypothetical protein